MINLDIKHNEYLCKLFNTYQHLSHRTSAITKKELIIDQQKNNPRSKMFRVDEKPDNGMRLRLTNRWLDNVIVDLGQSVQNIQCHC